MLYTVFWKDGNLRASSLARYREKYRASDTRKKTRERGLSFPLPLSASPLTRELSLHSLRSPLQMEPFDGLPIGHFTVMDGSEAEGDLVLIQTFFALLWKLFLKNNS